PGLQAINMGELSRAPIFSCAIRNSSDEANVCSLERCNYKFFQRTIQTSPPLRLFGRPTTKQWEKLPCRILALDRDGRSDPIARCALYYSTIAERRSGSTTEYGRVLSQLPRGRHGSWRRQSDRSWRRPLGF